MQTWKVWQFLAVIFLGFLRGVATRVEFEPCVHAVKNEPCEMTCRIPDFTQLIEFQCNGSSRGLCSVFFCSPNMIRNGSNAVHFQIPSMSYTADNCEWSCTHGTTTSSLISFTIYSGFSGSTNLTGSIKGDEIILTSTVDCLYPYDPLVQVQYSYESHGPYSYLDSPVHLQDSDVPGVCSFDIERRMTAFSTISAKQRELEGRKVFFRVKFVQYPAGPVTFSNTAGPFYFPGHTNLFITELPCFMIMLIALIMLMLILKETRINLIDFRPKTILFLVIFTSVGIAFGVGLRLYQCFRAMNIPIIVVIFIAIAIAIGVGLGLGLMLSDQWGLALGLSLGFDLLIVILLLLAICIYQ